MVMTQLLDDYPCVCGHAKNDHATDYDKIDSSDASKWGIKYGCRIPYPGSVNGECLDDCDTFRSDSLRYLEDILTEKEND